MTPVSGATVLVTGGQRGLGRQIKQELRRAEAAKVYVTSRTPEPEPDPRIVPLAFELSDPNAAAELARTAGDVSISR
ncbi:KR domain-containing protein [Kribbella sp. NPDC050281]|uniref:KR domain-containing protein n=1 Tax=Kribbella sp. NPDC050281 TaxID=3155515 RepID=UPI0033E0EC6C